MKKVQLIQAGEFNPEDHWYPKALNATIHPMISFFLNLSKERIIKRYCHLHPTVNKQALDQILSQPMKHFRWAGADLLNVTNESGKRQMVLIETNSCPSGQKSMPLVHDDKEQGSYKELITRTFQPLLKSKRNLVKGALAVIYDKNPMETVGYAKVLADVMKEPIYLVQFDQYDENPPIRFKDGIMYVLDDQQEWQAIRAAFRYVTQRPWNRIPLHTKTRILNPVLACLAGGRNKMVASKAYDIFNAELVNSGLYINTPETIWDVSKTEIPLWVKKMGGQAVVKVPYSNAGQGVFTIVTEQELEHFMKQEFDYNQFIVQSLIGNFNWSSNSSRGKLYHVGTIPNLKEESFVADIRMMVSSTDTGIRPLCVYARRARKPLLDTINEGSESWDMLGTNLSIKNADGSWGSDTNRLVLMDRRDFNKLGVGLDDLIEAYIQTVLATYAIDNMCKTLIGSKGKVKMRLFKSLNNDAKLLEEILL